MPLVGFEPATPSSKWPHAHASDRVATGIGEATNETTQNKKRDEQNVLSWIRTRDPSHQKAADLRLRPRRQGSWLVVSAVSCQRFT